ncbi:hypothetical protein MD484_g2436, partial [Candolleomyces efflorescens]
MKLRFRVLFPLILPLLSRVLAQETPESRTEPWIRDPASYVNAFIGTVNVGHVFPGANLPHGMIKAGLDTDSPGNHAGYDGDPQYNVTGFSQLHDSGTGGSIPLSNFKLWAYASCSSFEKCPSGIVQRKLKRKVLDDGSPDDYASPGYFSTNLTNNIRVELTATRRTALHRYTFPAGTTHPRILVDIANDGQRSATYPQVSIDQLGDGDEESSSYQSGRVRGGAEFAASFGPGRYKAFVCVTFRGEGYELGKPTEFGAYSNNYPVRGARSGEQVYLSSGSEHGALLEFTPSPTSGVTSILARVGVSFISTDQACSTAEEEIPDYDFEKVKSEARAQWNDVLGRVKVGFGDAGQRTTEKQKELVEHFYSSLYRTHIAPADYTGENPHWNSTEPYYDSLYCNWDTYRTLYPLMAMHDPITFSKIVRGMIDIQKHEGWLPECRGATVKHYMQGGSNADPILADFIVKYPPSSSQVSSLGVSASDLYTALLKDAEEQPPNWNLQGREVHVWKELGYIAQSFASVGGANTKWVSRTLEYAFDDFAIAQAAKVLGKNEDVEKYLKRAQNFLHVWNPDVTMPGGPDFVKGMMQPRFADGTWNHTDPRHCSIHDPEKATCFLNAARRDGFYEASPIVYSQYVPQDTAKLIELQGGPEAFIQRLDWIFENDYFDVTNEPSHQMPFMYHYANRPGLSTLRSRKVLEEHFDLTKDGLPGNDDSGAMGSYAAFSLLGMYPLPATRQLLISSPYFPVVEFVNPVYNTTTTFKTSGSGLFVKGVTIDGEAWHSICYVEWDIFEKGSVVVLELGDDDSLGCGEGGLPPSISTGGYA